MENRKIMGQIERNICINFNKYMEARKVTRNELAAALGTSVYSIARFLTGQSTPTDDQIVIICAVLDITIYELFGLPSPESVLTCDEKAVVEKIRNDEVLMTMVKRICEIK